MAGESTAAALRRRAAALRQVEQAGRGQLRGVRVTIVDDSKAGGAGLDRIFTGLGAVWRELPASLTAAIPAVRAEFERNFATQGANGRGAWAPLAEATRRERERLGYNPSGPILSRAGALRRHVLTAAAVITRFGGGYRLTVAPGEVVAGVPKYRPLARGNPASNLPGRPMVVVGPGGATRIATVISRDLRQRAAGAGFT